MGGRLLFLLITAFFIVMNVLLWQSDITGHTDIRSRLKPRLVWEKILTAAGESSLEIRHKGVKIGTARLQPNVGVARSNRRDAAEELPEGMIEEVANYLLEFDGTFSLEDNLRLRFGLYLKLSTNYVWQEASVRLSMRPHAWEIHALASEQKVRLRIEDENGKKDRMLTFAQLQQPDKLLAELGQPWLSTVLLAMGAPLTALNGNDSGRPLHLRWEARNDSITVQHVHIRGYRLHTKILDRYPISIFINPAGEILRIDLPGEVVLLSDALVTL